MKEITQEKSQIKQKILLYLQEKGVSHYEFYKKSGVTRGILTQNNGINEDNIARFLDYAQDINAEWLLRGEGGMLKSSKDDKVGKGSTTIINNEKSQEEPARAVYTDNPTEGIPLIPFEAMAGALSGESSQVCEHHCDRYTVPIFEGADFLISVKGSSMVPTFYSGDVVACRRVALSSIFFQWGQAYVIDTDQGPLIKRIKEGPSDDVVLIVSDNPDYPPFKLPVEDIHGVALVIGTIHLE